MYQTIRFWIWFVLICGGIVATLATYVHSTTGTAGFVGIWVGLLWAAAAVFSVWLFGLRRRLVQHMKIPVEKLTYVSKAVGASRIADYVRTFEHLYESEPGIR